LEIIARRKKQKIRDPCYDMVVVPMNFSTSQRHSMLGNLKEMMDTNVVWLDLQRHPSLVLALRPAHATDLILDK
jgi:hypothetical protein